jgi:hypothetical protein
MDTLKVARSKGTVATAPSPVAQSPVLNDSVTAGVTHV